MEHHVAARCADERHEAMRSEWSFIVGISMHEMFIQNKSATIKHGAALFVSFLLLMFALGRRCSNLQSRIILSIVFHGLQMSA